MKRFWCKLGFHEYEKREFMVMDDGHIIWERVCIHCGYSPTWMR